MMALIGHFEKAGKLRFEMEQLAGLNARLGGRRPETIATSYVVAKWIKILISICGQNKTRADENLALAED